VLLAAQQVAAPAPAAMLLDIKGIGPEFAAILWSEGLFRHFDNRRQVASYAGLAPTPCLRRPFGLAPVNIRHLEYSG
jgi:transposase